MAKDQAPTPGAEAGSRTADNGIYVPSAGMDVIVRGLTATRMPFLEKELLIPLDANTATVLVRPLLDPGTSLKVVFSEEVVEDAILWSISQTRQASKWRIWLRFSCTLKTGDGGT
ncbi:MAG TPA: hypothetical protein VN176_13040 [Verrucomicrobiae bacterium]|jgi:hypothetical protein|nr:hypothetical protein [Verrucomicrobiae bacterium]